MTDILQHAIACHQHGQLAEAESLYRTVLGTTPEHPDALALLGVLCDGLGRHEEAAELIARAGKLDPSAAIFKLYLGNALLNAKRLSESIVAFHQAIALQPDLAEAHYNLGNALRLSKDWVRAISAYEKAIGLRPGYAEAHNNLALAHVHEKQYEIALAYAKKAVTLAPNYGEAWLTLCNVAEQCKDYPLALEAGQRNIQLLPDNHRAWFGYGVALNRLNRNEEALDAYHHALQLNPERADIWDNLGQTYQSLNRLEEAEATFRKTIDVAGQTIKDENNRVVREEEYGGRHWHLALLELLRGKYIQGFSRYRARFEDVGGLVRPNYSKPLWQGEDVSGKTLLIWDEQGFGDTLMLCRYLPLLKERGARIIFSVHPVLKPLFENWLGADVLVVHGSAVSGFDYHASVFDLPHLFGTTLETIPTSFPYLPQMKPDATTQLDDDRHPKVGVVWGGSPLHTNDSKRSIPLALFSDLFKQPGVHFFSLNRDMKPGDEELLPGLSITDLAPRLTTFAESAQFVGQMDLIITCDTATAHLAGGLGKQVWTLLPFAPDWRWLSDRSDSPWYPSMRLFRQSTLGDWNSVIEQTQQALSTWSPQPDKPHS